MFLEIYAEIIRGVISATDPPTVQKNVYMHIECKCSQIFTIRESGGGGLRGFFEHFCHFSVGLNSLGIRTQLFFF